MVGFFGATAAENRGFDTFPWSVLGPLGQLSQPAFYGQHTTSNLASGRKLPLATKNLLEDIASADVRSSDDVIAF